MKRGILQESETVQYTITITPEGLALARQGLDFREETGTLSREQILSGAWKTANLRRYDVTKLPRKVYPGKIHPYQRIISEMREILLEMGFEELYGGIVQQSFWNFDALFQPQDHPAREMQDTFYLQETLPLPMGYEKVKAMHESGGDTSSTGWGGVWKEEKLNSAYSGPTPRASRSSTWQRTRILLSKPSALAGFTGAKLSIPPILPSSSSSRVL